MYMHRSVLEQEQTSTKGYVNTMLFTARSYRRRLKEYGKNIKENEAPLLSLQRTREKIGEYHIKLTKDRNRNAHIYMYNYT